MKMECVLSVKDLFICFRRVVVCDILLLFCPLNATNFLFAQSKEQYSLCMGYNTAIVVLFESF